VKEPCLTGFVSGGTRAPRLQTHQNKTKH